MTIYIVRSASEWCGETAYCWLGMYSSIEKAEKRLKEELLKARKHPEWYHSRVKLKDGHLDEVIVSDKYDSSEYTEYCIVPQEIE